MTEAASGVFGSWPFGRCCEAEGSRVGPGATTGSAVWTRLMGPFGTSREVVVAVVAVLDMLCRWGGGWELMMSRREILYALYGCSLF